MEAGILLFQQEMNNYVITYKNEGYEKINN